MTPSNDRARIVPRLAGVLVASLGASCGGGGSGGEQPAPQVPPPPVDLFVTPTSVARDAMTSQVYVPPTQLSVTLSPAPQSSLFVRLDHTGSAIRSALYDQTTTSSGTITINFNPPDAPGTYSGSLDVHVCYDNGCAREVTNSPVTVAVQYQVQDPPPHFSNQPLPLTGQIPLGHDVLDAEYSAGLDAVVMVAKTPANALHVHFPATGATESILLDAAPNSVSLSPDGLTAAVAHDSLITLVDLDRLDDPLVDPKTLLDVSTNVHTTVLPGNGYVYAFPVAHGTYVRSIELATGAETMDGRFWTAGSAPAYAHPAADRIYAVSHSTGLERFDITDGTAMAAYDSPSNDRWENCRNLWLHETGERIFTACGHLFRTSNEQARDMVYAGSLRLGAERFYQFGEWHGSEIKSLSHAAEGGEIALLEEDNDECVNTESDCRTQLSVFESTHYNLRARYTVPPLEVDGATYDQRGTHVFHSADGTKRYLVTRLEAMVDPTQEFWLGAANVNANVPAVVPEAPTPTPTLARGEAPFEPAPQTDFRALPHDVVDAEFSAALNAIVMVSQHPSSALYVYGLASGDELSIPLPRAPTAVSVSPDGLFAAVGHDGLITRVTLSADLPDVAELDGSLKTFDVVMGSNGWVYGLPLVDQWVAIHSIDTATNQESLSGVIYAGSHARLHPGGTRMYMVGPDYWTSVTRYSTLNGAAQGVVGVDHGNYSVCGNLWLTESGDRLITACGRVMALSEVAHGDLAPAGAVALLDGWRIRAMSQSDERNEIALIEAHPTRCAPAFTVSCQTHVNLYFSDTLTLARRYALAPLTLGNSLYPQRGLFVFHSADGTERFVISRLEGMRDPWAGYYVSRLAPSTSGV